MKTRLISLFAAAAIAATSATASVVPASAQTTLPVKFGKAETFEHASTWFTIDKPINWKAQDSSKEEEAIVTFSDPLATLHWWWMCFHSIGKLPPTRWET